MKVKFALTIFSLILLIFLAVAGNLKGAVRLDGSIKGRITDRSNRPVEGAYIYLSSPALVGIRYFLTDKTGYYYFLHLPAGPYKLAVEAPGFHTAIINDIRVETGKTLNLPVHLETAEDQEEEKILLYPLPALDKENPGISYILDSNLIHHTPRTKDLAGLLQLVPALNPEIPPRDLNFSVNGSAVGSSQVTFSGNELNHPLNLSPARNINPDSVEEIEIVAAGNPVENYTTPGAFIKIIPRPGQNRTSGQLQFLGTGGDLSRDLWSQEELSQIISTPVVKDRYNLDFGLNLEGSIMPDRVWYFTSFRYNRQARSTPFAPWRDPDNIPYPMYSWKSGDFNSLFRFTSQVTPEINASVMLSFNKNKQTVDPDFLTPFNPQTATLKIAGQNLFLLSANGSYKINQKTEASLFLFYTRDFLPRRLDPKAENKPRYVDLGSGYSWGSGPFNRDQIGEIFRAGASISRFQSLLGGLHELVAGAEYQSSRADDSVWKSSNLIYYYLYESPYYYGSGVSPETGNLVGKGLVGFYVASGARDGLLQRATLHRLTFYLRDTFNLGRRLNFSLGLKFERLQSGLAAVYKGVSGTSISFYAGEAAIRPVYGVNPYSAVNYPSWDNMVIWYNLSPRAGLVFDLLGTGKTLIKGSFGRYQDNINLSYLMSFAPSWSTGYHNFYWYDENQDGTADIDDTFLPLPEDYRIHLSDYFKKRVSSDLKAPVTTEWTASLEQQLSEVFTLSLSYLSRTRTGIIEDVLYDPDGDREWYSVDQAGEFWVPFSTVVPGQTGYGNVPVTVYFPSSGAPAFFTRLSNVDGLKQKYSAFQLVARKKMSDNWQLMASATWSRAEGNAGLSRLNAAALTQLVNSPNSLVNVTDSSRLDLDRPWIIKVMGTYRLPRDFYLSAFFQYLSGTPWARTVTVVPPAGWLESHQAQNIPATVFLEEPGSRRWSDFHSLDLRLERSFKVGQKTRLEVEIDVLNVLGKKYGLKDLNDGGYWYPEDEGSSAGTRIYNPSYQKLLALYGTRAGQLILSLKF
ncbi:MAG: carboxypeptidase-like regulatory domain-containing protein [Candidatus Saccharicenans sp.]|nr:carboxypeptidase-like regulatory domain-containing protein [Candidatus Saccharicenans sp.]